MNHLKTALLLGLLSGVFLVVGEAFWGRNGLIIALLFAAGMNFFSYFFSDKLALAMYSAQPVSPSENPEVYRRLAPIVQGLTQRMGLPMPKLFVIPDESPNAFATGRNPRHASVAVTGGILRIMDDRELEGVLAHELGHVKNRDILTSSVAATIALAITLVARMAFFFGGSRDDDDRGNALSGLLMLIVAPFAALLIQMWISRTREFAADAASEQTTGSPYPLISALGKLESASKRIPMDASPATAHMFIIKPFSGQALAGLFSTHPPTEERIARLREMALPKPIR
ncbi:MAG TPA: zinc metalloprotease HtpX [Bryobacteraceae bacterium]|nr:zinc metalloprotease HtpX [Bryobacteraceae bacterium]